VSYYVRYNEKASYYINNNDNRSNQQGNVSIFIPEYWDVWFVIISLSDSMIYSSGPNQPKSFKHLLTFLYLAVYL
tara:strand:+ start:50 stop:274 length:225 start_codon:yes stop_codon:yes gene_type:complete